jgi:hypothetical protein
LSAAASDIRELRFNRAFAVLSAGKDFYLHLATASVAFFQSYRIGPAMLAGPRSVLYRTNHFAITLPIVFLLPDTHERSAIFEPVADVLKSTVACRRRHEFAESISHVTVSVIVAGWPHRVVISVAGSIVHVKVPID